MCYLVAKNINTIGCVALKTTHGKHLSEFLNQLIARFGYEKIQFVVISRPSAYAEYEPYHFAETEEEFVKLVEEL